MTAYVLDTNTLIYAINQGAKITPNWHTISFITELELLSYHELAETDRQQLRQVLINFDVQPMSDGIKECVIDIRCRYRLKLPDSIVVATAKYLELPLITSDIKLQKVTDILVYDWQQVIL